MDLIIIGKLRTRKGNKSNKAVVRVASGTAISVGLGEIVRVTGVAVKIANGTAIGVSSGTVIGVAGGTVIKVASGGGITSLFKIKLSQSYKATVIISLILIRAKPISLSIYL